MNDAPTAWRAVELEESGDGGFLARIDESLLVFGVANGGYVQVLVARAALLAARRGGVDHPHATAVTTNFSRALTAGPAQIEVTLRRSGRSVSFARVEVSQAGEVCVDSLVSLGLVAEDSASRIQTSVAPLIAPATSCRPLDPVEGLAYREAVETRRDPTGFPWWDPLAGPGEVVVWLRRRDGHGPWDALSAHFAADVVPPATLSVGSRGWVPTIQLSTYLRGVPRGEWLLARQWIVVLSEKLVDERCELFDEDGRLVMTSSQLAMVRRPREPS